MLIKGIRKGFYIFLIALLALLILINAYQIIAKVGFQEDLPKIFGYAQVMVVSGSMEPTLLVGDLLIIHEQDSYKLGDIITYRRDGNLYTHRVVEIIQNGDIEYITRGDFNNVNDEPAPASTVEGKVVKYFRGLGDAIYFMKSPIGILTATIGVILLVELPALFKRLKRIRRPRDER
jgi:signal peptidase